MCLSGAASPVYAGPPNIVAPAISSSEQDHSVRVLLAQSEINSAINSANSLGLFMAAGGLVGGLLGGIITASQNASRAKKAEELITPIRAATVDLDVDALALETSNEILAKVAWLDEVPVSYGKDSSPVGKSDFLDANPSPSVVFIEYSYDLSPDFDALRVTATMQVANKALPKTTRRPAKPADRVMPKYLAYSHTVTSVVLLPEANPKEQEENAARWAADNGAPVRLALDQAFAELADLAPRSLALTKADIKQMKDSSRPKAGYASLKGRLVEKTEDEGSIIWAGQFVSVEPLHSAPTT